jgi:hypothetical protein
MFNYVPVKLIVNESQPENYDLFSKSIYFTYAFPITRDHIITLAVEHLKRSESLDIWKDIKPKDGQYTFELAIQLPFYLPRYKKAEEYLINMNGREYIISNRHCELILENKNNQYYLAHYLHRTDFEKKTNAKVNQVVMSKTLVLTKFKTECITASKAIESNYENWLTILNQDIPNLVNSLRYHLDGDNPDLPDCNDIGRFCPIYVICIGEKLSKPLRFASHIAAYPMQTHTRFSCDISEVESFCNGKTVVDMSKVILRKAISLLKSGELSTACILACTACETYLSNYISKILAEQGLSKTKEKDAFNDITFSHMLNLLSYFVLNMKDSKIKELIGTINNIRKIRNDIIHDGKWLSPRDRNKIENGIEAIKKLKDIIGTTTLRQSETPIESQNPPT